MFYFLTIFCVAGAVLFFTLGHIYGYEGRPKVTHKSHDIFNAGSGPEGGYVELARLYPRWIKEDVVSIDQKEFEFVVIVFGWRRKESLERLVNSLKRSDYLGKTVQLQFHIEFEPSEAVKEYVESVKWPFGTKLIIWRKEKFGLERMVVESWDGKKDNEFAFFFEDDIEVNEKYFEFAIEALNRKELIENESVIGVALNTPRYDEVGTEHSIWLPEYEIGSSNSKLFLFQQPCSWGALYFPWKWREYLAYYQKRRRYGGSDSANNAEGVKIIPKSCVVGWKRSWKKYFMEMMLLKGYVMIYPSLPNQASLSVHHREEGEHTGIIGDGMNSKVDYFIVPLTDSFGSKVLIEEIQRSKIEELPIISFYHFRVGSIEELKEFGKLVKRDPQNKINK